MTWTSVALDPIEVAIQRAGCDIIDSAYTTNPKQPKTNHETAIEILRKLDTGNFLRVHLCRGPFLYPGRSQCRMVEASVFIIPADVFLFCWHRDIEYAKGNS
jgi:hypothetical protein